MSWDALLAVTHPGKELEVPTGERWLVLRRSYSQLGAEDLDRLTVTVELVRVGSPADPRRPPEKAP